MSATLLIPALLLAAALDEPRAVAALAEKCSSAKCGATSRWARIQSGFAIRNKLATMPVVYKRRQLEQGLDRRAEPDRGIAAGPVRRAVAGK